MTRLLIVLLFMVLQSGTALAGDTVTLIVATPEEAALRTIVATPEEAALQTAQFDNAVVGISLFPDELSELFLFDKEVDNGLTFVIVAGTDFSFMFQYRIGDMPAGFEPGRWPKAQLRTAKSPKGRVLATFTAAIEDEARSIWSIRLSKEQTRLLAGQSCLTEQSYADANGLYQVHDYIRTTVIPKVTGP